LQTVYYNLSLRAIKQNIGLNCQDALPEFDLFSWKKNEQKFVDPV